MRFGADDDGYVSGRRDDVGPLLIISTVGVGLAALSSFLFVRPTLPPPATELRGCYVSSLAPNIFFDGKLMHIGQGGMSPTPYHLTLRKTGIDIATERPRQLLPLGSRYVFDKDEQRTINFGRLAHIVDGKIYGVLKTADAEFIEVLTPEANNVRYDLAASSSCHP